MRIDIRALVAVLGGIALVAPADAAVLCAKRAGAVIVRPSTCRKSETRLDLAQFGALGPQGATGDVGPRGPSDAFSVTRTGPIDLPTSPASMAHLDLGPGKYVIFAKAWFQNSPGGTIVRAACTLDAEADSDLQRFLVPADAGSVQATAVSFNLVHEFTGAGRVDLDCQDFNTDITANDVEITAIQVASFTTTVQP